MFVTECNLMYITAGDVSHGARLYTNYMCTGRSSNCDCYKEQTLRHWEASWFL